MHVCVLLYFVKVLVIDHYWLTALLISDLTYFIITLPTIILHTSVHTD